MLVFGDVYGMNMEPTNQPFRKENDLNQTSIIMCKMLIFPGCSNEKKLVVEDIYGMKSYPCFMGIIINYYKDPSWKQPK